MSNKFNLIYGIRAIIEAIEAGKYIEKILLKKQFTSPLLSTLRQLAKQHNIPIQYVPVEKLNRLVRGNHQGAVAFISPISFWNLEDLIFDSLQDGKIPLFVMLDRVTDVHNFGAIVRTADAAAVTGVIIPTKNTAQISGDAMKTSAGALNYVPIVRFEKLSKAIKILKDSGFQIVAASEKGEKFYYDIDFTLPTTIIMGAEDTGISPHLLREADEIVKIPMLGNIESLNVSNATAILLYKAVEQRIKAGLIKV